MLPQPGVDAGTNRTEYRILTPSEINSLETIFADRGQPLPDPTTSFIAGAIRDGQVVAFLVVQLRVHTEPLWLSPGAENTFLPLIHLVEETIADRVGVCDTFAFAPAGKVTRMCQLAGMQVEPWVVLSKRISREAPQVVAVDELNTETQDGV